MLPKEIFDPRKSKTRDPKRKFATKEYLMEIGRNTRVTDLKTEEVMDLENAVDKFGIIDLQLIDFAGSVFLDNNDWTLQLGFNRLFTRNEIDNESLLLEHKLRLIRYIRNFQHERAMDEFQQVMKFGEADNDKFSNFRYTCLKARILMRWRRLQDAQQVFKKAFAILDQEFSERERLSLIVERKNRMRDESSDPNWDTYIVDYDEVFTRYLNSFLINWINNVDEFPNLLIELQDLLEMAQKNHLVRDEIDIHHLIGEVAIKLNDEARSRDHLEQALSKIENQPFNNNTIIIYGEIIQALLEIYGNQNDFDSIEQRIIKLENIYVNEENKYFNYVLYRTRLVHSNLKKDLDASFNLSLDFLNTYIKENHKFEDISHTFIIREIYELIVKGIELELFQSIDEVSQYIDLLKHFTSMQPVTKIYEELVKMRFIINNTHSVSNQIEEQLNIENKFNDLLINTQKDPIRFIQVALTNYEAIISLSKDESEIKAKSRMLASKIAQGLIATPFVRMIVKNEVLLHILNDKMDEIKEKLFLVNEKFGITEIHNMLTLISKFEEGGISIKEFITMLFLDDVKFSNFDKKLVIPIDMVLYNS